MLAGMVSYGPRTSGGSVPGWVVVLALVFFFPAGIVLMWMAGSWSLRAKRAVTGAIIYPFGLYVLLRHTRLPRSVRVAAVVVTIAATAGIGLLPDDWPGLLVALLAGAFLALYLGADHIGPGGAAALLARLRGRTGRAGAAAVEEARSAPERRLLLAREITRLAERALAIPARDRDGWPAPARLAALRAEAAAVLSAARDRSAAYLPEGEADDPLSIELLTEAATDLARYVALVHDQQRSGVQGPEALRVLLRERTRLQLSSDRIVERIRAI